MTRAACERHLAACGTLTSLLARARRRRRGAAVFVGGDEVGFERVVRAAVPAVEAHPAGKDCAAQSLYHLIGEPPVCLRRDRGVLDAARRHETTARAAEIDLTVVQTGHGKCIVVTRGKAGRPVPAAHGVVHVALVHMHGEPYGIRVVRERRMTNRPAMVDPILWADLAVKGDTGL